MEALRHDGLTEKIKFVGVYLRKSRSMGDMEEDLIKHKKKITEYCEQFDWSYVLYEEIGSGYDLEGRGQMQKLLRDVEGEMYDAVFVFDIDRLSRGESSEQDLIFSTLRNTNTLLVTANPFKIYNMNDETDDMMIDVFGFVGKMEYKQIRKRMTAGKKIGLRMGRWVGGQVPYGYRYNNETKGLDIHEDEARIVREMVDKYLSGISTTDIAWEFNRRRILSPRGSNWTSTAITRIFKSLIYQGHMVGNKYEGNPSKKKRSKTSKKFRVLPESEWVIVRNCHEAIIKEEEYDEIMKILGDRSKKRYKNKINTFTGLIKCGICGNNMYHKKYNDKDGIAKCECGNMGGIAELIETAIYESAIRLKDKLNEIKSDEIESQKEQQLSKQIDNLEKELDKQDLAIERIEEAFESGLYDVNKTRRKIEEREQEKWRLEKEISNLRKQITAVDQHDNKERITKVDRFISDIKQDINSEQKNKIYKEILSDVVWYRKEDDKVGVTVNFL